MLASCKAPLEFWDEFCATSAYLTNLMAIPSLQNWTPFELWFGRKPSLSHLREIGCHAFTLIPTAVPKSFTRSRPCILIGYSPHSKAYRLWDPASGQIFNSFHVSFVEHLDEAWSNLLPGTTMTLAPDLPPSWDTASKPRNDPQPPSIPPNPFPIPSHIPTYFPTPSIPNVPSTVIGNIVPNQIISTLSTQNNTIPSIQLNNVTSNQNNTVLPNNTVSSNQNNTVSSHQNNTASSYQNNNVSQNKNNTVNSTVPTTVTSSLVPPPVTPLHRSNRTRFSSARDATNDALLPSSRLSTAISESITSSSHTCTSRLDHLSSMPEAHVSTFLDDLPASDFTHAFLSEFSDLRETHDLLFLDLPPDFNLPLQAFLSDIETGSLEPTCDTDDDPSWREALALPDREYWIAGAREELRSLQDLHVFILVPRSEIPQGKCVLKGKLVCKQKQDDTGKIT